MKPAPPNLTELIYLSLLSHTTLLAAQSNQSPTPEFPTVQGSAQVTLPSGSGRSKANAQKIRGS